MCVTRVGHIIPYRYLSSYYRHERRHFTKSSFHRGLAIVLLFPSVCLSVCSSYLVKLVVIVTSNKVKWKQTIPRMLIIQRMVNKLGGSPSLRLSQFLGQLTSTELCTSLGLSQFLECHCHYPLDSQHPQDSHHSYESHTPNFFSYHIETKIRHFFMIILLILSPSI